MRALLATSALLCIAALAAAAGQSDEELAEQMLAPDGTPYATETARDVMQMQATGDNLLRNGSFEAGRWWPEGWQVMDRLTTFWHTGGTDGERCLRVFTNVLDTQWKSRFDEVRAAVREATEDGRVDPQKLPENPVPKAPERIPTRPPYYDTVAGLHGVHYRSHYVPIKPRAIYRFSVDARTDKDTTGEPMVFIKGFFDQKIETGDGVQTVRRNAYRAPMTLDPCDKQWRRYARLFHPWRSKSTLGGKPLEAEVLQVQLYAYWRPGNYYFDNVRLDIVGMEEPEEETPSAEEQPPEEPAPDTAKPAPTTEDGFPVFDP